MTHVTDRRLTRRAGGWFGSQHARRAWASMMMLAATKGTALEIIAVVVAMLGVAGTLLTLVLASLHGLERVTRRGLFGGLLAGSYERIFRLVDEYASGLTPAQHEGLFGGNCARFYGVEG